VPQQATEFPFTAAANEWLSLGLTELSEPANRFVVKITAPDGTSQSWDYALSQYIPTMVYKAKAAGTYRLAVTFGPNQLGFGKIWLSSVINGTTLGINGAEASMRIERPGQSVRLPFNGTTGQNLQLGYSENLLQQNDRPYYPGALLIEPDEVQRELPTGWAEARSLPTLRKTGTHHLLITGWQAVGTVKAWLSTAIEGGTLAPNTRASVTIDRPGRDAFFDFNGTAGRPISGGTINNAIPGEVTLRLFRPNGSQVSLGSGRGFDVAALPDTGRYRLQIDPESPGTGRVNVYLAEPVDLGAMALDSALPAPVNLPGQKVIGRFTGQVGQRLSLGTRTPMANLTVRVYKPDGALLTISTIDTRFGLDLPALTVAGEHRIEITTLNRETGDLTVYLSTEVDAGDFTVDGANKTITVPRPVVYRDPAPCGTPADQRDRDPRQDPQRRVRHAERRTVPPDDAGVRGLQHDAGVRGQQRLCCAGPGARLPERGEQRQVRALVPRSRARVGATRNPHPRLGRTLGCGSDPESQARGMSPTGYQLDAREPRSGSGQPCDHGTPELVQFAGAQAAGGDAGTGEALPMQIQAARATVVDQPGVGGQ
jgi:hypothetical protein